MYLEWGIAQNLRARTLCGKKEERPVSQAITQNQGFWLNKMKKYLLNLSSREKKVRNSEFAKEKISRRPIQKQKGKKEGIAISN